jgi:hypothetical protein
MAAFPMKTLCIVPIVVPLVVSTSAGAEERAPAAWEVDAKVSYVVLGAHAARATGGIMPSLTGLHLWPLGEAVVIGIGADVGLFGLGGVARWIGVLGGPTATGRFMPFSMPLSFELSVRLDFGRIPVCNAWGLCLRSLGFFPAIEAGVAYRFTQHVAAAATCGVRIIQTLAWSGASVEPAAAGRVFW